MRSRPLGVNCDAERMVRIMDAQTLQVQTEAHGAVPALAAEVAVRKVRSLLRLAPEPVLFARVKLTMAADPAVERPAIAQVNLDLNGRLIRAQATGADMREAVNRMSDRLRIQLERAARNWAATRGGKPVPLPHEWRHQSLPSPRTPYFPRPPEERKIIRHKAYALARQSPEEAITELELLDYDFYLFTERATGQDSVLYRTADWVPAGAGPPAAGRPGTRPRGRHGQRASRAQAHPGRCHRPAGGARPAIPVLRQQRDRPRQPDLSPLRRRLRRHHPTGQLIR